MGPSRTRTCWADAWYSQSPSAEICFTSCAGGGVKGGNWAQPLLALHPLQQENILEHRTNQLQKDLLGEKRKDWDFPAYRSFTELHVPLCSQRGKLG